MMEKRPLMKELTQGRELANQLKHHLDTTCISPQSCDFLLQKILSSYEKALSLLINPTTAHAHFNADLISPATHELHSDHESPHQCNKSIFKKRKTMEKWSEQVKLVCSGSMVEGGPLSTDGYSWRKYGQKEILGANHPRAYYRCTHRNVQGCLATKQVQRSNEDSSVFEVTYRGRHTCIQATQLSKALEKKPKKEEEEEEDEDEDEEEEEENRWCVDQSGISFKAYKGGELEAGLFPSFSFASTPTETDKLENDLFYLGCDSTTFNLQTSDSDLSDHMLNSTPNSVTNSPFGDLDLDLDLDLDFPLDHVDFGVTN